MRHLENKLATKAKTSVSTNSAGRGGRGTSVLCDGISIEKSRKLTG